MTCQEMVDFVMRYLDGELPEVQAAEFKRHMEICPPCLVYLETYKRTVELGQKACADPQGAIPDDVPEQLVQAILAARQRH